MAAELDRRKQALERITNLLDGSNNVSVRSHPNPSDQDKSLLILPFHGCDDDIRKKASAALPSSSTSPRRSRPTDLLDDESRINDCANHIIL